MLVYLMNSNAMKNHKCLRASTVNEWKLYLTAHGLGLKTKCHNFIYNYLLMPVLQNIYKKKKSSCKKKKSYSFWILKKIYIYTLTLLYCLRNLSTIYRKSESSETLTGYA